MPNPLSDTQTRQVEEEVARQIEPLQLRQRRLAVWLVCLVLGVLVGGAAGIYFYAKGTNYARTVSCQRGQAVSLALRLVVTSAIPRHERHRTPAEQAAVDALYKKFEPALKVPRCD